MCAVRAGAHGEGTQVLGGQAAFAACFRVRNTFCTGREAGLTGELAGGCWAQACLGPDTGCREGATAALCPGVWGSVWASWPASGSRLLSSSGLPLSLHPLPRP